MSILKERSYHFADFIRFVAMCAIIFQHSFIVDKSVLITDSNSVYVFFFMKVMAKIGSISFFIVSGFLLSAALERYTSKEYLHKRVKNIFRPYILFVIMYLILDCAGAFFGTHKIQSLDEVPLFITTKILGVLFFTSYWFIFNYFISVMILLSLRRYLYDARLGIGLFMCTMVYAVNVHFEWFTPHHTTAFAGFVFFLWLGANLKKHEEQFWNFIDGVSIPKVIVLIVVTLGFNLYETFYLLQSGATVIDSSLKVTNIAYALSVFILLCKVGRNVSFGFFNPRDETYPLYLIHPIFLKVINYAVLPLVPAVANVITIKDPYTMSWVTVVIYQVAWFIVIYMISLISVKVILNSRLKWVFGKQTKPALAAVSSQNVKSGM
jgi:fucose 4-O-acetylase-like acetyltransferase